MQTNLPPNQGNVQGSLSGPAANGNQHVDRLTDYRRPAADLAAPAPSGERTGFEVSQELLVFRLLVAIDYPHKRAIHQKSARS